MKRDTTLFAQDLKVDVSGEEIPYDTSHIYTGEIYGTAALCIFHIGLNISQLSLALIPCRVNVFGFPGEKGTLSHGALVDGKFEGFIQSYQGTYYVEPAERYLEGKNVPFHSVIYHEDDIRESPHPLQKYYIFDTSTGRFISDHQVSALDSCIYVNVGSGKCEVMAADPAETGGCDGPPGKSSFPRCSLAE